MRVYITTLATVWILSVASPLASAQGTWRVSVDSSGVEGNDDSEHPSISADGRYALSGSEDNTIRLWFLDWELDDREPADWDAAARPYLQNFLTLHTPPQAERFCPDFRRGRSGRPLRTRRT